MEGVASTSAIGALSVDANARIETADAARPRARYDSVDVLRGITVGAMVVVNNPGNWTDGYRMLAHADWNGWTLADLVFPSFLFIVGVSITISLGRKIRSGEESSTIAAMLLRRVVILFALGLFLNAFPDFDLATLRIPGVLQRIAVCYGAAGLLFLGTEKRYHALSASMLLLAYWALMSFVPVPGHGAGALAEQANLAAYIDDACLHGHLLHESWDPEGILSTLPAIATVLLGVLAGEWMQSAARPATSSLGLIAAGTMGIIAGELVDPWFPINKQLWTSSFVLFTGGIAAVLLGLCQWLIEGKGLRRWAIPFLVIGTNALGVYLLSSLVASMLEHITVTSALGAVEGLRLYLFERLFLPWAGPRAGSLLFAISYLCAWLAAMTLLYRRRVFLRV